MYMIACKKIANGGILFAGDKSMKVINIKLEDHVYEKLKAFAAKYRIPIRKAMEIAVLKSDDVIAGLEIDRGAEDQWEQYSQLSAIGWKRGTDFIGELFANGYSKEQANLAFEKIKADPNNVRTLRVGRGRGAMVSLYNFPALPNPIEEARSRMTTVTDEDIDRIFAGL